MPVGPRVKDGLRRTGGYLPIEGYGLIGDCRSAALVGLDGSIDFLCLPRFDSDAVFSRILDATRGGCWEIRPAVTFSSRQHYRDRTNLLDSIFTTGTGIVALTDYMPVDERDIEAQGRFRDEPRVVRHVECLAGHVRMRHVYDPRPGFAREHVALTVESDRHVHADAGRLRLCLTSTVDLGPGDTTFTLRAGEAAAFALRCGRSARCGAKTWSVERSHELFRATRQAQVRSSLAGSLKAVFCQRLIPHADGMGRIPAMEVLVVNGRVADVITEHGRSVKLATIMEEGASYGMQTFDQSLVELVRTGLITPEDARAHATNRHDFGLALSKAALV